MARIPQKLSPFQNVGSGVTAVLPQVNTGMTVQGFMFQLGGTFTVAQMNQIRVRIAGKQFVSVSGAHLLAQNKYEGLGTDAGFLFLPFADFRARSIAGEMSGGIDQVALGAMDIEIDIDGAAVAPTLSCYALTAPPKSRDDQNRYAISTLLKAVHSPSAAGEYTAQVPLGSMRGAMIDRVYAHGSTITGFEVTKDGLYLVQDASTALLDFMHKRTGLKAPQADLVVFDPEITGNVSDAVSTQRRDANMATFQWKYTTSGAGTITTYSRLRSSIERV